MAELDQKAEQGAGEKKLMDRLVLFFWSGAGGIKIMNRLILVFKIWLALFLFGIVGVIVVGEWRGAEATNRRKVIDGIFQTVCTNLPEIESSSAPIPIERVETAVRNAIKEDMTGNFWLCQPGDDDDPLVVYSGPLTDPFVMILFRYGGTTSWSKADWERDRAYKTAVKLSDLRINH